MSLDTVIKIGKFYRETKDAWKYHDQINWAMNDVNALEKKRDREGNTVSTTFYEVNVIDQGDRFLFDFDSMTRIVDEDKIKSIYYLNFKTSKKDSSKRYLLGDLVYSCYQDKKGDQIEGGNYRMYGTWADKEKNGIKEKKSSFWLSEDAASYMDNPFIQKFRSEFRNKAEYIEQFLKGQLSVVIHFNFDGQSWQDMEGIIDNIDVILTQSLVKAFSDGERVVLDKYLYKTLGGVTPGFGETGHKNRLFTRDEIVSLMYAGNAAEKPLMRVGGIGLIALPHSKELTSDMVVHFFERDKHTLKEEDDKEVDVTIAEESDDYDSSFVGLLKNNFDDLVKFDIIFTNVPSSPAGVFSDLIEFADVQKSLLRKVHQRITECRHEIEEMAYAEFPKAKEFKYQIRTSFLNLLGDVTKDKKKYQSHLLKVLPQIYTDTYYEDSLLLPVFLEKVEYNIRNDSIGFNLLKYDFYFLMKIQKKNTLMMIKETKSYALGKQLGIMAQEFAAWKPNCPIKSFEKSYVGNLSRRTASLDELVKFAAFLNEKLTMHGLTEKWVKEAYLEFAALVKSFEGEKYSKNNCSLGFFESYYNSGKHDSEKEEAVNAN